MLARVGRQGGGRSRRSRGVVAPPPSSSLVLLVPRFSFFILFAVLFVLVTMPF